MEETQKIDNQELQWIDPPPPPRVAPGRRFEPGTIVGSSCAPPHNDHQLLRRTGSAGLGNGGGLMGLCPQWQMMS